MSTLWQYNTSRAAERLTHEDIEVMNAMCAAYARMGLFDKLKFIKKGLEITPLHFNLHNFGQLY
jgi:hypothetical protein